MIITPCFSNFFVGLQRCVNFSASVISCIPLLMNDCVPLGSEQQLCLLGRRARIHISLFIDVNGIVFQRNRH
jgi:hypothetical protein